MSQLIGLDIPWNIDAFFADLEHLLLLVVVHLIIISQFLNQKFHRACRSQVNVVNGGLGHYVEAVIELALEESRKLFIIASGVNCWVLREQLRSQSEQLFLGILILLRELNIV